MIRVGTNARAVLAQEKTLGTVAAVSEGKTPKEGAEMLRMILSHSASNRQSGYAGYAVEIDAVESTTDVHYGEASDGKLARFTYRVFCLPSDRRFVIRHFHDATAADRADTERGMRVVGDLFHANLGIARRYRRSNGTEGLCIKAGRVVDDPFAQLELEMMIDLETAIGSPALEPRASL